MQLIVDRTRLPQKFYLRKVEKGKLFTEVRKVNELLKKIKQKDVSEDNELFYLGAALVTKAFGKITQKEGRNSLGGNKD